MISIFDFITLGTFNKYILKKNFSNPRRGYGGQKPENDFKRNDRARIVGHTDLVMTV